MLKDFGMWSKSTSSMEGYFLWSTGQSKQGEMSILWRKLLAWSSHKNGESPFHYQFIPMFPVKQQSSAEGSSSIYSFIISWVCDGQQDGLLFFAYCGMLVNNICWLIQSFLEEMDKKILTVQVAISRNSVIKQFINFLAKQQILSRKFFIVNSYRGKFAPPVHRLLYTSTSDRHHVELSIECMYTLSDTESRK